MWLLLSQSVISVFGQPEEIKRIEMSVNGDSEMYRILPADTAGFVLYRKKPVEELSEIIKYEFVFFNADLEKTSSKLFEAEYIYKIISADYEGGYAYFLFEAFKNFKKQWFILKTSIDGKNSEQILVDSFFPDFIDYFEIYDDILIIGGEDRLKPSVVFYYLSTNRTVVLQGLFIKRSEVLDMHIDRENEVFTVLSTIRNNRGQTALNLRSYDNEGMPIENVRIDPAGDKNFTQAKATIVNNQLRVISGTYRYRKAAFDEGIFVSTVQFDGEQNTRYYPFMDVMELLDSLKNKQGINTKTEDYRKEIINFDWEVTRCMDAGNDNVVIIESGQKVKSKEIVNTVKEFYAYNKALVLGFDDQMDMTWMNDFDLKYLQSPEKKAWIDLESMKGNYRLSGFYHHSIFEKWINKSATVKNIEYFSLIYNEETKSDPISFDNEICDLKRWYDNYSLYSGIKQFDEGIERKYIFYIEKIKY